MRKGIHTKAWSTAADLPKGSASPGQSRKGYITAMLCPTCGQKTFSLPATVYYLDTLRKTAYESYTVSEIEPLAI